jgi:hypothetical protein
MHPRGVVLRILGMTLEAALHGIRIAGAIVALLYAIGHPVAPASPGFPRPITDSGSPVGALARD